MKNNQSGSIMLPSVALLFIVSGFCLFSMNQSQQFIERSRELSMIALCMKSYLNKTKSLIDRLEKTNKALKLGNIAEVATWIPVLWGLKGFTKKAKKIIMSSQQLMFAHYLASLKKIKCPFSLSIFLSPVKHKLLLARDKDSLAMFRARFRSNIKGDYYRLSFNYQYSKKRFYFNLKDLNHSL